MLVPSIFGENLFDDDWMVSPFDRFEREFWGNRNPLYGKNAKNMICLLYTSPHFVGMKFW